MKHRKTATFLIIIIAVAAASCTAINPNDVSSTVTPGVSETVSSTEPSTAPSVSLPHQTMDSITEPADSDFILVKDYIPAIHTDLKYATADNITGKVIYEFSDAYLRYGTLKKLITVQEALEVQGYSLIIWDAFRPVEAQFKLWEAYPDPTYVTDPNKGFSTHSKGNTLDVTLVCLDGTEVVMPTGFDDFSALADRDYSDADAEAAQNALLLEQVMQDSGFTGYSKEWWHYSDTTGYPAEEEFTP